METQQKKSTAIHWIIIALLAMVLLMSLAVNMGMGLIMSLRSGARSPLPVGKGGVDEYPSFHETWAYGRGDAKAVHLNLDGVITRYAEGGFFETSYDVVESFKRQVRAAIHDKDVKALIVDVNSPGGVLTPSDELYRAIKMFRDSREDRRVVVFVRDLAASGAYMVSMAGDWIIAEPTAIVGSIGVIIQTLNWKSLSEKIGVTDVTIVSDENKDLLNPWQDIDPQHRTLFKNIVNTNHQYFMDLVATGRDLPMEEVRALSDGRIFTAEQSVQLGLVDQVGYWEDALDKVRELTAEKNVRVIRYEVPKGLFHWLSTAEARFRLPWNRLGYPRLMSIWK